MNNDNKIHKVYKNFVIKRFNPNCGSFNKINYYIQAIIINYGNVSTYIVCKTELRTRVAQLRLMTGLYTGL
jgi:hypothetical protein